MLYGWFTAGTGNDGPCSRRRRDGAIRRASGPVELGQIGFLMAQGFSSNRTDLIRAALRKQSRSTRRPSKKREARTTGLGQHYNRRISERALASIESMVVLGTFYASPAAVTALASRIG